jgi:hypothetical protein
MRARGKVSLFVNGYESNIDIVTCNNQVGY